MWPSLAESLYGVLLHTVRVRLRAIARSPPGKLATASYEHVVAGRGMMPGMAVAGDLSDAERRVWDAFPTGAPVAFGTGRAEDDDPAGGEGWGPDRQVRAEVLAALLYGAVEVQPGPAGEIHL